jgi:hypothetical protein
MSQVFRLTQGSPAFTNPNVWSLSRPVETSTPLGERVGVDEPRFGHSWGLTGLPGEEESVDATIGPGAVILNAGVDRDGLTPLLMVYDQVRRELRLYREQPAGGNGSSIPLLRTITCPTDPQGLGAGDVLSNAFDGCPVGTIAFEPANAVIIHGTIVLLCRVRRKVAAVPGTWNLEGVGIVYSTDLGSTWIRYWDDTNDPRDINRARVSGWEMTNYYAPFHAANSPLLRAVIPFCDYRLAGTDPIATGGRACWFELTRATITDPFIPRWSGAPGASEPRMAVYTLDITTSDDQYCHFHSCGITEYTPTSGPSGWQVIIGVGDGLAASMIRIIITDTDRYWESRENNGTPKWQVKVNWHGTIDSAAVNPTLNNGFGGPGLGAIRARDSNTGNQFVGIGPGPDPGTLLIGADAVGEGIWILEPGHTPSSKPRHTTAVSDAGTIVKSNCFFLRVPAPERSPRLVACDMIKSFYRAGLQLPRGIDGVWISYDSGNPGTFGWISSEGYTQRYAVAGAHIYFANSSGTRIVRRSLPPMIVGRPLAIGPGGGQWLRDDPLRLFVTGTQMQRCPRDAAGFWLIPAADGSGTLGRITPQPPTGVDAVYRVSKTREQGSGLVGYITPSATSPPREQPAALSPFRRGDHPADPGPGERVMRTRWWMLNASGVVPDSAQEAAGRSASIAFTRIFYDAGPGAVAQLGSSESASNDRWEAVVRTTVMPTNAAEKFALAMGNANDPGDGDFFIAWSDFAEGHGSFGYPMPADPCDCPTQDGPLWHTPVVGPTRWPDERAAIKLGTTLQGSWTLLAAGVMPDDSWDQYSGHDPNGEPYRIFSITDAQGQRSVTIAPSPLMTFDRQSTLDVLWRNDAGGGEARMATGPLAYLRGRPLLFAIVCRPDGLRVYAASGGVTTTPAFSATGAVAPIPFTQVRFGGGDFARVDAFQWFGLRALPAALTESEAIEQFRTLAFLQ